MYMCPLVCVLDSAVGFLSSIHEHVRVFLL